MFLTVKWTRQKRRGKKKSHLFGKHLASQVLFGVSCGLLAVFYLACILLCSFSKWNLWLILWFPNLSTEHLCVRNCDGQIITVNHRFGLCLSSVWVRYFIPQLRAKTSSLLVRTAWVGLACCREVWGHNTEPQSCSLREKEVPYQMRVVGWCLFWDFFFFNKNVVV